MKTRSKSTALKPVPPPDPASLPQRVPPRGPIALAHADVSQLDALHSPCNLRRDLHAFVNYVRDRSVKRAVRGNTLPKADAARLAKLMSAPAAPEEVQREGSARWIDFVDHIALRLDLVSYDTKGVYAGYTSQEASFPDNYVVVNASKYEQFIGQTLAAQERKLLDLLTEDYRRDDWDVSNNEFYATGVLGRLERFDIRGAATGVMPSLEFDKIRRFLLEVLAQCEPGVWLSTAALVAYLKAEHPFFLIPQKPRLSERDRMYGRYGNFYEHIGDRWSEGVAVPDDAPDGFERVEGRYVERFLEGAALTLGYVDVAYGESSAKGIHPERGVLQAFRVKSLLARALRGQIAEPTVTVQPNFEVFVQAEVYPARVLMDLARCGEVMSSDIVTIVKLRREKVADALARDEKADLAGLLRRLSGRDLPQNVARELREWTQHSEKFTLYVGFGLLEGDDDLAAADEFTMEQIKHGIRLVRSSEELYGRLEQLAAMPLLVKHADTALHSLPPGARTVFPIPAPAAPKPVEKPAVTLQRETTVTLHFPSEEVLEEFRGALLEVRCSFEVNNGLRTITYAGRHEGQVAAVVKALGQKYRVSVADLG